MGDSEILRIKHPPTSHIPALGEGLDDRAKVLPSVAVEQAHDVFKHQPLGPYFFGDAADFPEEACARSGKACSRSHAADVLAGEPGCDDIDAGKVVRACGAHVVVPVGAWEVPRKHLAAVCVELDLPGRFVPGVLKAEVESADAGEQAANRWVVGAVVSIVCVPFMALLYYMGHSLALWCGACSPQGVDSGASGAFDAQIDICGLCQFAPALGATNGLFLHSANLFYIVKHLVGLAPL